jgi:four helix bundle protein
MIAAGNDFQATAGWRGAAMRDFRSLKVWGKAHRLVLDVYKATAPFPRSEFHDLTRQIRRASASIPANISEGCGRGSAADLARFLHIAMGSASELEYHLLLSRDLKLLAKSDHERLAGDATEIKRMLAALIKKLSAVSCQQSASSCQPSAVSSQPTTDS